MKIVVDVKNVSAKRGFIDKDILLYDGKDWYVTNYEDLFSGLTKRMNEIVSDCSRAVEAIRRENAEFYAAYSEKMSKLTEVLETVLKEKK